MLGFKRGLERILKRVDAPAVPLAIDGLWGASFHFLAVDFSLKCHGITAKNHHAIWAACS